MQKRVVVCKIKRLKNGAFKFSVNTRGGRQRHFYSVKELTIVRNDKKTDKVDFRRLFINYDKR